MVKMGENYERNIQLKRQVASNLANYRNSIPRILQAHQERMQTVTPLYHSECTSKKGLHSNASAQELSSIQSKEQLKVPFQEQ